MKSKFVISIIVIFNLTGIMLNGSNFFMGGTATYLNCAISVIYMLLWISLNICAYLKKDLKFSKFEIKYWIIALVISIMYVPIVNIINSNIGIGTKLVFNIIGLFYFILFAPLYGLELFLELHFTKGSVGISIIPIIFVILGIYIYKSSKSGHNF